MLIDIFSCFDPICYASFIRSYFVWVGGLIFCIMFINSNVWVERGGIKILRNNLVVLLFNQSAQTRVSRFSLANGVIIGIFFFLVFLNFLGLLPYVFSPTSHLRFSFGLSFSV